VKTGNPNGGGSEWPRYDPASRAVLNFTNKGVTAGPDPPKERRTSGDQCGAAPVENKTRIPTRGRGLYPVSGG
jgi:hypothetical protein